MTKKDQSSAVEYDDVPADYLDKRQLKKGAAGWILLAGLGVSYVISGDFSGWNFGLEQGGWGGMFIATVLMATMYTFMIFGLAELSSSLPTAGGGYSFARRAMGPWGGFLTGTAILLEYTIAPAAIAVFIGGYINELTGFSGPAIYAGFYIVFVGIHLFGVGEALKIMMVITSIAVIALLVFAIVLSLISTITIFSILLLTSRPLVAVVSCRRVMWASGVLFPLQSGCF